MKLAQFLLPLLLFTLSACDNLQEFRAAKEANSNIQQEVTKAAKLLPTPDLTNQVKLAGVIHSSLPYIDFSKQQKEHGDELPSTSIGTGRISIPFGHPLAFDEIVSHIQHYTSIEVEIIGDLVNANGKRPHDDRPFYPVAGLAVREGEGVIWRSGLDVMLNQLTHYYGYDWHYKNGRIYITLSQTRMFNLNVLNIKPEFSTEISSSSSSSGSETNTNLTRQSVKISGYKIDIWKEVKTQIELLLGRWGQARYSETTGTIIIEGRPSDIKAVRNYLRVMNQERLRLVSIGLRVVNVRSTLKGDYDFNVSSLIQNAISSKHFIWQAGPGGNTAGIVRNLLPGQNEGTLNATLKALSRKGVVTRRFNGSAVNLSDYPMPIQDLTQRTIVSGVSQTNTDNNAQNSITTKTFSTGTFFTVIPRIIQGNQILIDLTLSINDLVGSSIPQRTVGNVQVDLPVTTNSAFKNTAVLESGDTLVLAGFLNEANDRSSEGTGLPENVFFGGSADANTEKNTQVLLLTAEILPPLKLTETEGVILR